VVVAKWTVLIALVKVARVFPKAFLALLAREGELVAAKERMVLGLGVAFGTVKPLATCSLSC